MKNSKFLLPLFLISLFGLVSCRNESIDAPSQTQTTESTKKRAFDPKPNPNDDVYVKLRLFNEQLRTFEKNASLREVQTMPVDKVVWNVEAYLNAAYGHSDKPFTGQKVLQDSFVVALTNGEVLGSTVVSTLASAKSLVIEQYRKTAESGKHIVFIDITSKPLSGNQ